MYSLADEHSVARTDYGVVLLNEATGKFWNLNPSGALVLDALLGTGTVESAAEAVMREFAVDSEIATADAAAVLEQLLGAGILVPA
ncbi:MAG: hypothetical protein QOH03_2770 [Kribbellaceae bacterium]|nr:hypothetical protein [Kribbellaceae bacterium]